MDSQRKYILLSDSSDRFAVEFRAGALGYAKRCGLDNVRLVGEAEMLPLIRSCSRNGPAHFGVIGRLHDPDVMGELQELGVPCILWGEDVAECWRRNVGTPVTACASDHRAIGRMAAGHLFGQERFRSYVYVEAGSKEHWRWWADQRYEGFASDLRQRGLLNPVPRVSVMGKDPGADQRALLALLGSLPKPIGVFCCNDRVSHAVVVCCRAEGIRVPDEVALLGVDDAREICEHAPVALSSILVDRYELGGRALRLMDEFLLGRPVYNEILRCMPVRVVERESTRQVGAEDVFVTRAMRLIDRSQDARLSIEKIVLESGASRSYLERHFKLATGETIHGYLEESILREVQHQLATTNMPVTCIASSMGYDSPAYLCTKFRRRFGVTMQAYRKSQRGI